MKTKSENFINKINFNIFFREFSFSNTTLKIDGVGEIELADHLVIIDELCFVYQIKERNVEEANSTEDLSKWFNNKIEKKAVSQIKDSLKNLEKFKGRKLLNEKNHQVAITPPSLDKVIPIIIYQLDQDFNAPMGYFSSGFGFIHYVNQKDYFDICMYLVTPAEIYDYFEFREKVLVDNEKLNEKSISEYAFLGQYLSGNLKELPNINSENFIKIFKDDLQSWDISLILKSIEEKIISSRENVTDYYKIIAEFAKLNRSALREIKKRLILALNSVKKDILDKPYRVVAPSIDCGFLVLPVQTQFKNYMTQGLLNYCIASKYELKNRKHIGIAISKEGSFIDILWAFIEDENQPNLELDSKLRENYPFREVKETLLNKYFFDSV
ncbi:hypothetical protein FH589_06445 [Leptospira interrogans]|uniref:hypothetical protein n=1 Tax=Leptospira interrogans TaxID=173 RepID=UPI0010C0A5C0|nr:hypothetical protein [Leptospira interrogans]KAA1267903.1 hypothetical protein C5473_07640 [Leptospira interrogans serovar Weerasinghe]QCO40278.1 hypothetical protein E4413_04545 [Leptospira interrogans]ULG79054.1 hypothetical protein FH595_09530 [Leptospira interrogans]ULG92598.1 hypothetical protein FH584_01270 [Leptospira interrogans]UML69778.1 hypothetical protein FH589_06445 [Leptospira interrogans]